METLPEQNVEMSGQMPGIVRDHLQTVGWGTQEYPVELLELREKEVRILQLVDKGMRLENISKSEGISYREAVTRCGIAQGKHDAKIGFNGDVTELSPMAQRVVILNSLFGATWNKGHDKLIFAQPEVVLVNAKELDIRLGKWRRCPNLCVRDIEKLKERIERYDAVLSPNWRNVPVLLTQSQDVVEERAAIYDGWFGKVWQGTPSILTNDPKTVISSARALKTVGIILENTPPGVYFVLLGTTVANKRNKAAFIRRELLGHTQVYIHEGKKTITEIVQTRQGQTQEDKDLEVQEIAEFKIFIKHLGAKGLSQSITVIEKWADSHGYRKKPK